MTVLITRCAGEETLSVLYPLQLIQNVMAWTDSTIVINCLEDSPRRFKTYVSNRISFIISHVPPNNCNHVCGEQNPAE